MNSSSEEFQMPKQSMFIKSRSERSFFVSALMPELESYIFYASKCTSLSTMGGAISATNPRL